MASVDSRPVTDLLLAWQAAGRAEHFTALVTAVRPLIERRATTLLRRCGIRNPAAIDDAVSLVLDHLRRLHAASNVERLVASFTPRSLTAALPDAHEDEGRRYVVWLTKSRTRDIMRAERRRTQKTPTFTDAFSFQRSTPGRPSAPRPLMIRDAAVEDPDNATDNRSAMVVGCVRSLPEDQRQIVELLLAGLPQAVIARALGISAGTLSRRKSRAFATLRNHLCDARQLGSIGPAAAASRSQSIQTQ